MKAVDFQIISYLLKQLPRSTLVKQVDYLGIGFTLSSSIRIWLWTASDKERKKNFIVWCAVEFWLSSDKLSILEAVTYQFSFSLLRSTTVIE